MNTSRLPVLLSLSLLSVLVVSLMPRALEAQEEPTGPEFEEEIQVTEVILDVLVTDSDGKVIVGLDENDFVVEEDGEPVEVTGVDFYSNRELLGTKGTEMVPDEVADDVRRNRYFVLFFHDRRQDLPAAMARLIEAGGAAKEWVRTGLLPNDWVAVVSFDHKLKLFQDFTTDTEALVEAIDTAVEGGDPEDEKWPSRTEERAPGTPTIADRIPTGKELQKGTYNFQKGLTVLARTLDPILGRKNVLLFSFGFGEIDSFGNYSTDPRWNPPMTEALNDANVAVYPIHLLATRGRATVTGGALDDSLSQLADDTGGRFYQLFNRFEVPLEQVEEENNGYYLLSYQSRHPADDSGFQTVEVRTTNPKLQVRHRRGYLYGR